MKRVLSLRGRERSLLGTIAAIASIFAIAGACSEEPAPFEDSGGSSAERTNTSNEALVFHDPVKRSALDLIEEGRNTFRFDTFGDEAFWGGQLKLHLAIAGAANGGVGQGVDPVTALNVGLKVDVHALPPSLLRKLKQRRVDLTDPAVTLALLKLNAVVGLTGFFGKGGAIESIGIQCALCHSTVDDSLDYGIGRRLDGWPNRDLDVGAIIALAPDLSVVANLFGTDQDFVRMVVGKWGPGKFDAELFLDGKAFNDEGKTAAVLIPKAFGLAGVNLHTWTGWGSITHWNAFVANLEMHGKGTFFDPRLDDASRFPIAAKNGFGHILTPPDQDRISSKLPALQVYQLALPVPKPPRGSFDEKSAALGRDLFVGKARCARCHVPPIFSEPGWNMHTASEIDIDDFQAKRSPDGRYRTAPLRGLFTHQKGGFYHDGRFRTLLDVVNHYDRFQKLVLSDDEKKALVEYLKSL